MPPHKHSALNSHLSSPSIGVGPFTLSSFSSKVELLRHVHTPYQGHLKPSKCDSKSYNSLEKGVTRVMFLALDINLLELAIHS